MKDKELGYFCLEKSKKATSIECWESILANQTTTGKKLSSHEINSLGFRCTNWPDRKTTRMANYINIYLFHKENEHAWRLLITTNTEFFRSKMFCCDRFSIASSFAYARWYSHYLIICLSQKTKNQKQNKTKHFWRAARMALPLGRATR